MGVVDRMLEIGGEIKPIFPWANQALVEFCILCDGHTLGGKSVAVLGHDPFAARTALDLLHFHPSSVEMLTHGHPLLEGASELEATSLRAALAEAHIRAVDQRSVGFDEIREQRFGVRFADGSHRSYDRGFSALGWYRPPPGDPPRARVSVRRGRLCRDRRGLPGALGDERGGQSPASTAWATSGTDGTRSRRRGRPPSGP